MRRALPREMDTEPDPFVNREAAPEQSGVWDSIPKKEHTDDPSSAIFGKLSAEDEDKAVGGPLVHFWIRILLPA